MRRGYMPYFADAWGSPIPYRLIGGKRYVYSFGMNLRDDGGNKDDLLYPLDSSPTIPR